MCIQKNPIDVYKLDLDHVFDLSLENVRRMELQIAKLQLDLEYERNKFDMYMRYCCPYLVKLKMLEEKKFARPSMKHAVTFLEQTLYMLPLGTLQEESCSVQGHAWRRWRRLFGAQIHFHD